MQQLKIRRFSRDLADNLKTVQLIFTKLMSFLDNQSYVEVLEINRLNIGHSLWPW